MIGLIDDSGIHDIPNLGATFRTTASLTSTAAGRKIELSINNGQDYFDPELDVDVDGNIGVVIRGAVTNIRFTGDEGDEWGVLL